MFDWRVIACILAIGMASYATRITGFLAFETLPEHGGSARLLRLAPGNLAMAFIAVGCSEGGWVSLLGSSAALLGMVVAKREWAALLSGFVAAALTAAIFH